MMVPEGHDTPRLTRRELLTTALVTTAAGTPGAASAQPSIELPSTARELWQWVRSQPVMESQQAYLDTASAGPSWRAAMAAEYRAREMQSLEIAGLTHSDRWVTESNRLAARFAAFLGCDPDELCFTSGTGAALGTVINGMDLASGDEVITTTREHPAALSPWLFLARRRGITVKQIELPAPLTGSAQALGLFAGAATDRTRVFAFSHVQYADGAVLPVRELCQFARQRNITTIVDGAQATGMLDLQLRELGCDAYATCFHKWLGGPHGTGALFLRREMLDRVWPSQPRGIDAAPPIFTPTQAAGHSDVAAGLHRFGNLVPHLWPALRGAESALDLHQLVHRARIEARIRELVIYARLRLQQAPGLELLTPALPGLWGGILAVRAARITSDELARTLARNNRIYVRSLSWPDSSQGALRISLHVFNTHDEIDRFIQALTILLRNA